MRLPGACRCALLHVMLTSLVIPGGAGAVAHVLAAAAVLCAITLPLNWLAVWTLKWGLDGSALAAVACEVVYFAALLAAAALFNARHRPPESRPWQGWSRDAFNGWRHHLKIAAAGTLMLCLDWWQASERERKAPVWRSVLAWRRN